MVAGDEPGAEPVARPEAATAGVSVNRDHLDSRSQASGHEPPDISYRDHRDHGDHRVHGVCRASRRETARAASAETGCAGCVAAASNVGGARRDEPAAVATAAAAAIVRGRAETRARAAAAGRERAVAHAFDA